MKARRAALVLVAALALARTVAGGQAPAQTFETTDRYGANGMDDVGSYGWGGAYGTLYRINPRERLTIMLMVQILPNTTDIREKFPLMVYQALLGAPKLD